MTIAACYLSPEGVVFGADSTSTYPSEDEENRYYNYAQKIFQVGGPDSTLGVTLWGLGGLGELSYRTVIAQVADNLLATPPADMAEVARRFADRFWHEFSQRHDADLKRTQALESNVARTPDEDEELDNLKNTFSGGFCLGGYLLSDRTPRAYEIGYDPTMTAAPNPEALVIGEPKFWGCPNIIRRLTYGIDLSLAMDIMSSSHWTGTPEELGDLIKPYKLTAPATLPIREAIDWIHASVYSTIKAMKFSQLAPVCGGPVEIAAITTDRPFRWVRHKRFTVAIEQGGIADA